MKGALGRVCYSTEDVLGVRFGVSSLRPMPCFSNVIVLTFGTFLPTDEGRKLYSKGFSLGVNGCVNIKRESLGTRLDA